MTSKHKKQSKEQTIASQVRYFLLPIFQLVVSYLYTINKFKFPAAILVLIIVVLTGNLLTRGGLLLVTGILLFIMLHYFVKWLDKQ